MMNIVYFESRNCPSDAQQDV